MTKIDFDKLFKNVPMNRAFISVASRIALEEPGPRETGERISELLTETFSDLNENGFECVKEIRNSLSRWVKKYQHRFK